MSENPSTQPNLCGSCTMCCKIMGVQELSKPEDTWCSACAKGKGCTIYESRPHSCREFECLWLWTQKQNLTDEGFEPLDESMRPDRSKVVLDFTTDMTTMLAHVDPGYPNAYREGEMGNFLKFASEKRPVLLRIGNLRRAMGRPEDITKLVQEITLKQNARNERNAEKDSKP